MTTLLIFAFFALAIAIIYKEFINVYGVYSYLLLSTLVFIGFVGIQLIGLNNRTDMPDGAVGKLVLMSFLCLLMVLLGDIYGRRTLIKNQIDFDIDKLYKAGVFFSMIGALFFFLISRLPEEARNESLPSGIMVALNFFAQMMPYGLVLISLVYAETRSARSLYVLIFDLLFYLDRLLVSARRGETAVVLVILALAFWFRRGVCLSKFIILTFFMSATLFIYSTGDYRNSVKESGVYASLAEIDFSANISEIFLMGGPELELAAYTIEASARTMNFDYGAFQWNTTIFKYVPAQLVGANFKTAIMIPTENVAAKEFGYVGSTGSTSTGMADLFKSFWYFGALIFFLISYTYSKIYYSALQGVKSMQILYMTMLVNGLHAITHNTNWFFSPWIHIAIFLVPALRWSRI